MKPFHGFNCFRWGCANDNQMGSSPFLLVFQLCF
uniref:Uncharacterized protein n=1 Tax=Arundo donax TaxID=35708 RepID=A0A0A9H9R3_ARUDO